MPLPKKIPNEKKEDFISRFMSDVKMVEEYPDEKQRYAIALSTFSQKIKKEIGLTPPKEAQNNAKKALAWKEKYGDEVKGGTSVGWTRARQLASGKPLSERTVRRMASFNRHRQNSKVDSKHRNTPWKDRGYIAWLIWGGTAGIDWAIRTSEKLKKEVSMAKRLKDVKVKYISILTDDVNPSNRQEVIIKSDNSFVLECEIEKEKTDIIKGLLYATAMKAMYEDTDKEYYENEDVEKAAHEFMKSGIENRADRNHSFDVEKGVYVVESYVEKKEEGYEWKVAFDISENEDLMLKAKEGTINGVSIAGKACPAEEKEIGKIEVETKELDIAIEKANVLKSLMQEIVSLSKEVQELNKQEITPKQQPVEPIVESVNKDKKKISLIKKMEG